MSERPEALHIEATQEDNVEILRLRGEIDLRSSPRVRGALLAMIENSPPRIIVDLSGVIYMDSSGVGTMVEIKRRVEQIRSRFFLVGLQPRVRSVFELTQLDKFFAIAPTVDEARRA